jgi:hypothetical protein
MPEVTDPRLLQQLNQSPMGLPTQPMPFPGAMPTVRSSTIPQRQAEERLGLDYKQDARAGEALQNDEERLRIAREKADRDQRTAQMNAGVDTTASQDQAVGHAIMLQNHLTTLNDVMKNKGSEAARPTWKEWGVAKITGNDPTLVGMTQGVDRQRAAAAYRGVLESAIWLYTGAAAPVEQVENIRASVEPLTSDSKEVLEDKRRALLTIIAQAKARSGPANAKVADALDYLQQNTGLIYGDQTPLKQEEEKVLTGGEGDTKSVPIPPAMQAEHDQFMKAAKPGELTVEQYVGYYNDLTKRHGIEGNVDLPRAKAFVDAFNEGRPIVGTLPSPEVEQGVWEQIAGGVAASPVGTFAKNYASATTLGAPELLAGREGREASAIADELNPKSALAGEVTGSIAPALALEKAAAKGLGKLGVEQGGRAMRVGADVGANAVTGGVTEFNQTGGDLEKGLEGAAFGAGGSLVGRGVAKGFDEFKPKQFRDDLDMLGSQDILDDTGNKVGQIPGVDLTTPQRVGGGKAEEFVEGFPGVAGQRQKSVDDWNRHNSARVLARVGLELPRNINPGQQANAYVHQALGREYDKIAPQIKGAVDKDWQTALAAIRADALKAPKGKKVPDDVKEMWQHLEDAAASLNVNGKFDYDSYKKFAQQVREWQRFWASSKMGTDEVPSPVMNAMARRAEDLLTQGRALVSRANPAAGARLKKIDTAWRHQMINDIASLGAAKQNRGVAAPAEWLNAVERMDFSKGRNATAQGKAFEQPYGQAAMDVIGKKPSRGGSVVGTGALGYTVGGALLSPALLATYAPGIKRLTQLLTDGKLGGRMDDLMPEKIVTKYPELKELPSDVMKQVIAGYIRESGTGAGKE